MGSGKSVVGAILADLGAHVIDADKIAHRVYVPQSEGWRRIVDAFGNEVLAPEGTIDRKKLAAIVFADAARLGALNAIVHPLVFAAVMREIDERRAAGFAGPFVLEAPVLLEAKAGGLVDRIWVVTAPRAAVRARLAASRDLRWAEVDARLDAQLSDDQRREHADLVIENDADLAALRAKVEEAWCSLGVGLPPPGGSR